MTQEEKVQYWTNVSNNDLKAADVLFGGQQYLYTCFMCHQTIEKIFKGCFGKLNLQEHPHIHNLATLAQRSNIFEMLSEEQKNFIATLNPFNIEARYPDYKKSLQNYLTKEITQDVLTKTKELQKWTIETILSQ